MSLSVYKKQALYKRKLEALEYYQKGLSLRQVASIMKVSHQWVKDSVDELSLDKNLQRV